MKYMAKHLQGSAEELEESYNEMILKVVKVDPSISERGIKAVLEQTANRLPEAKNAKPDDFLNTEIINKLRRDGYLRLIYAEAISDPLSCAVSRYVRLERDRQSVLLNSRRGISGC